MNLVDLARKLRPLIVQAAQGLDDKDASTAPQIFGSMKYGGDLIRAGTKINWHGIVKKAAVDLWDRVENNPDTAPALWVDITYRDGIRIIPAVITSVEAFGYNELGWWNDVIYKSLIPANTYTPEQYSAGWIPYHKEG